MTHHRRGARILLATILTLSAGAVALSVWAVSLLERMVYFPYPPNECAVVGAYLLYGRRAIGAVSEGIPLDTVNGCADAAAPYAVPTEIVVWTSAGFDFLAALVIVVLLVVRHRLVKADRAEQVARTGVVFPRQRISRIGWVALGLSVAAIALLVLSAWGFNLSLEFAGQSNEPFGALLFPYLVLLAFCDFAAAIVMCILAGTKGRGNRRIGILGGLIMISPIVYILGDLLVGPIVNQY
jgi:hypothetical protein